MGARNRRLAGDKRATLPEAERTSADEYLLGRRNRASLPVVPDRFGLMFPLAASCVAIVFAGIAFAIAILG